MEMRSRWEQQVRKDVIKKEGRQWEETEEELLWKAETGEAWIVRQPT
jgi:hypothetical protein